MRWSQDALGALGRYHVRLTSAAMPPTLEDQQDLKGAAEVAAAAAGRSAVTPDDVRAGYRFVRDRRVRMRAAAIIAAEPAKAERVLAIVLHVAQSTVLGTIYFAPDEQARRSLWTDEIETHLTEDDEQTVLTITREWVTRAYIEALPEHDGW